MLSSSVLSDFTRATTACFILLLIAGGLRAQTNTAPMPINPPVGIGTELSGHALNALHIHYDPTHTTLPAMIRLSEGDTTAAVDFGLLGLMPTLYDTTSYTSSLTRGYDLILHDQQDGDIIITNFSHRVLTHILGGAIRFATTPDTTSLPIPPPVGPDLEHETILKNGNIGFDLPPDTAVSDLGLGNPQDQIQIGGGSTIPPPLLDPGYLDPIPGLSIYGGNRFEGMLQSGGMYPLDYRYIAFNNVTNHADSSYRRHMRIARMASCGMYFSEVGQGQLELNVSPYDSALGLNSFAHQITMNLTGQSGLALWVYDSATAIPYHHLFDVWPPGFLPWPITRNTNGLFYHHTPVYIGSDTAGQPSSDFQNLPVRPDMGDDNTWDLVVNGPVLVKELFVLDSAWADYVFDPGYKLPPLAEVENYMKENRHLPDIPSAKQMAKTGVPVGRTEAAITKQLEETMLYVVQLSKQNGELSKQNDDLNQKFEKLEKEFEELKNQKER